MRASGPASAERDFQLQEVNPGRHSNTQPRDRSYPERRFPRRKGRLVQAHEFTKVFLYWQTTEPCLSARTQGSPHPAVMPQDGPTVFALEFHSHNVQPQPTAGPTFAGQPMSGRPSQKCELSLGHEFFRARDRPSAAGFHFNKYHHLAGLHHQVDFTAGYPVTPVQTDVPAHLKEKAGQIFTQLAESMVLGHSSSTIREGHRCRYPGPTGKKHAILRTSGPDQARPRDGN